MRCFIFALLFYAITNETASNAAPLKIKVASLTAAKLEAVQKTFELFSNGAQISVEGEAAPSDIAAQPASEAFGELGACNRLKALGAAPTDYSVSIENYIAQDSEGLWQDYAYVLVRKESTQELFSGKSQGTLFPQELMAELGTLSPTGYETTIGSALHRKNSAIDPQDWHKHYSKKTRRELILDALWKALHSQELSSLKNALVSYENFPKPGVLFHDFFPIMADGKKSQLLIDLLAERFQNSQIDTILGLESRGFVIGAALKQRLGEKVGFVPVRKAGKLAGPVYQASYEKEYGLDTFEISQTALSPGQKVLIIDDLIATGGSARAAIELATKAGAEVVMFVSLLEVTRFKAYESLSAPVFNLLDL